MTLRICGFVSTCLFLAATVALAQTAGSFAATGSMITPRWGQTATLLPSGKVLIAGGRTGLKNGYSYLASAEVYDPSTGIFTAGSNFAFTCGLGLIGAGSGRNDGIGMISVM